MFRISLKGLFFMSVLISNLSFAARAPLKTNDPYLWLEEIEGEKALSWVKDENKKTFNTFSKRKGFSKLKDQIFNDLASKHKIPHGELFEGYVYNFWQDQQNKRGIWRRTTLENYLKKDISWEVLLDLDELSKRENKKWSWAGKVFLRGGTRCLIGLSREGRDAFESREFDLKTLSFVKGGFTHKESKGFMNWSNSESVYMGLDFGEGSLTKSGYPRIIKVWKRGESFENAKTIFEGEEGDLGVYIYSLEHPLGGATLIERSLTFYESLYYIKTHENEFVKLPLPLGATVYGVMGNKVFVHLKDDWTLQNKDWVMGSVLILEKDQLIKGEVKGEFLFKPDDERFFEGMSLLKDGLIVHQIHNVMSEVLFFKRKGDHFLMPKRLGLPEMSKIWIGGNDPYENIGFLTFENFLSPDTLVVYNLEESILSPLATKKTPSSFSPVGYTIKQFWASSKDKTKVPYFVVAPEKLVNNGQNPTLIYGYGGFEFSLLPFYSSMVGQQWLKRGGVYVVANIRGGGEFGPSWHQAALKKNRHKAFEDFEAISEDLIKRRITSPQKLAVEGGSNGGLLVGAMMTRRPDLYKAVVCKVPILDMLRYSKLLAGSSWIGEYGDPDDPKDKTMREYLKSYSPYHQVRTGVKYPEIFFMTSGTDDRVHPGHARKMAKKMKDQGHKVHFYETSEGGHSGIGNVLKRSENLALQYSYLYEVLGFSSRI